MTKNIVLFSDGTGNSSAKLQKTNVWRLFQAIDQTKPNQIASYDNGVGTSSNRYLAAIGGALGWGLKRNVLDLYKFVCRNYQTYKDGEKEDHDDIYAFGFSRGSFTIRVLVGLIANEGLVVFRSEEELNRNAAAAYRRFRSERFRSWSPIVWVMRRLRNALLWLKDRIKGYESYRKVAERTKAAARAEIPIRFLGLWDTVGAYGMPIDELKRGIHWVLWPMMFGDRTLSPQVQRACHALSLDDERTTFHPILWDQVQEAEMVASGEVAAGRITQVWFAGVHANVGGGYPEDQLSLVSFEWMTGEAVEDGLIMNEQAVAAIAREKSPYARLYDSRAGVSSYYRYGPRQIRVEKDQHENRILPIIHGSVIMRMAYGSDHYSPISLPHEFWVLAPDGELLPMEGAPLAVEMDVTKKKAAGARPATKSTEQIDAEKALLVKAIEQLARPDREAVRLVWDTVFWRRSLYFFTVFLTLVLVAYPRASGLLSSGLRWLLTSIPIVGGHLHGQWDYLRSQWNSGSRGPITMIVDALSGLIPAYAEPWKNALINNSLEFGLIVMAIFGSLFGSKVLQGRIHDRARLAWDKTFREDYAEWARKSQKGWRNAVLVAFGLAVAFLIVAFVAGWQQMVKLEFALLILILAGLYAIRAAGERPVVQAKTTAIEGTFALWLARLLRNSRLLQTVHSVVFGVTVPVLFALLLVAAGWWIANRAMFDIASASGRFCKGSVAVDRSTQENIGTSSGEFQTDSLCWRSGLVLKEGQRYRIILETPGNWFDRTIRADVAGFAPGSFSLLSATPLKRWWSEDWFRPIARIGEIGNDEYVLAPKEEFEKHEYPSCPVIERQTDGTGGRAKIRPEVAEQLMKCAPTPDNRNKVVAEIKARTTGELFLYVNDAVLMLPGLTDFFVSNNTGTATVSVKPAEQPPAARN